MRRSKAMAAQSKTSPFPVIFMKAISSKARMMTTPVARWTLEMGRTYIRLVKEGKLPPPKRTIHFLWVPEISGTNAWLNKHTDLAKRIIADLNFDMEGLRLSTSASAWVLHRTPDTFPTFLNDLGKA